MTQIYFLLNICLEWSTVKCNGDTHKICPDDINVRWVKYAQTECKGDILNGTGVYIPLPPTQCCSETCLQSLTPYYNKSQPPGIDATQALFYLYVCFNVNSTDITLSLPNLKNIFFRYTCINQVTKEKSCLYTFGNTTRCSEPKGRATRLDGKNLITNISILPDEQISKPSCDLKHLTTYQYFNGQSAFNFINILNICTSGKNIAFVGVPKYKLFFLCPEAETIIEKCPGKFQFDKNTQCSNLWANIFSYYQGIAWKDDANKCCKVYKYKTEKYKSEKSKSENW